uniref:Uncharacterized protein n=1 Tax=Musa acuminata subsp. malaccensis TaxID=214687 RepID=A0A804HS45_MUSAM
MYRIKIVKARGERKPQVALIYHDRLL